MIVQGSTLNNLLLLVALFILAAVLGRGIVVRLRHTKRIAPVLAILFFLILLIIILIILQVLGLIKPVIPIYPFFCSVKRVF